MIAISVRGLPRSMTEEALQALFSEFGVVRSLKMAKDMFSGDCRGFAVLEMEGHEARAAMSALDGKTVDGSALRVGPDRGPRGGKRKGKGRRR
ncbi:MAG: RNA-binding protein [Gammaproteobacteria bacterium]|nr:MAG: RNA-binding protein [Gammaproteobacteria bacterium]